MNQRKNIVVVGGANIEYILKSKDNIVRGSKNFVDVEEFIGGSGVNYTMRLLSVGSPVYPILFVGNDENGKKIHKTILDALSSSIDDKSRFFIQSNNFFVKNLKTPQSTIVVEGVHRTILSSDQNNENIFKEFVKERLSSIEDISALIIGHIRSDREEINHDKNDLSTIYAIENISDGCLVYSNFGRTQIEYGVDYWKKYLCKIDIFQLNVQEFNTFFKKESKKLYLKEIIKKIRELNINAIVTLDRFGAIGIMKDLTNALFMARPVNIKEQFVDSTGAGDAFCAGMVYKLSGNKNFTKIDFKEAMEMARSWAAFACQSYGGANHCPSRKNIEAYHQILNSNNEVVIYEGSSMYDLIALIDTTLSLSNN
jgi:sugar/nucleoside kinase (ribokinase family)